MRTLLRFIVRYQFVLIFLLLEGVSIWLLASNNFYQRAAFGNITRGISGNIYRRIESATKYLRLNDANEHLLRENIVLRSRLAQLTVHLEEYSHLAVDTSYDKGFIFVPARIISNSVDKQHNYLMINVGRKHGVAEEMGVVSSDGVVGIVTAVSENYATVISLLNIDLKISARVKKNRYFGSLYWNGKDYRQVVLSEIPNHVLLTKGDTVVTSGFSSMFPADLLLGTVREVDKSLGNFLNVTIDLAEDFRKVDHVWVVKKYN
jgi:rod shape-determining protein MreC